MYLFETVKPMPENSEIGKLDKTNAVLRQMRREDRKSFYPSAKISDTTFRPENSLFAALAEAVPVKQMLFSERIYFETSEAVYNSGDQINYLYFPESAIFSDYQLLEDGRTIETATVGGEGAAGLLPFLGGAAAGNWTQVLVAGSVLRISTDVFGRELTSNIRFQAILFNYLNGYANQIAQRVACNSFHSVERRFCGWLKNIARQCALDKLPLTQEQIARSLGVHRPTISLVAKMMQRSGIIDYRRGSMKILSQSQLEETACDCFCRDDIN